MRKPSEPLKNWNDFSDDCSVIEELKDKENSIIFDSQGFEQFPDRKRSSESELKVDDSNDSVKL